MLLQLAQAEDVDASAGSLNTAGWTLLTHEVEGLRDPDRALAFAERACALAEESDSGQLWVYLDTLALALHELGDAGAAVETQRWALSLMPEGANASLAERLAEYEALKDK